MTKLSVNVNKIATLRNARGQDSPNLISVTKDIIKFGAQGITLHPRPDERHIKVSDLYEVKSLMNEVNLERSKKNQEVLEYNIEGYPSTDFINMVSEVRPEQVTLVPDPPDAITSNAGWDFIKNLDLLIKVVKDFKTLDIRVSLFLDPHNFNSEQLEALKKINPERVELYTESFAKTFNTDEQGPVFKVYQTTSEILSKNNFELNAGHDLSQNNINFLVKNIPQIKEVSIGHALVCESLYMGLEQTISNYLNEIKIAFGSQ